MLMTFDGQLTIKGWSGLLFPTAQAFRPVRMHIQYRVNLGPRVTRRCNALIVPTNAPIVAHIERLEATLFTLYGIGVQFIVHEQLAVGIQSLRRLVVVNVANPVVLIDDILP